MTRDVHRREEAVARAIGQPAVQVFFGCKGDRVQSEIEPSPVPFDRLEHRFELARLPHVAR